MAAGDPPTAENVERNSSLTASAEEGTTLTILTEEISPSTPIEKILAVDEAKRAIGLGIGKANISPELWQMLFQEVAKR